MTAFVTDRTADLLVRAWSARLAAGDRPLTRTQADDVELARAALNAPPEERIVPPFPGNASRQLTELLERRDQILKRGQDILAAAQDDDRDLTDAEERQLQDLKSTVERQTEHIKELRDMEIQQSKAIEARAPFGDTLSGGSRITGGRHHVYSPRGEHSFLRDLVGAKAGDGDAIERLRRNESLARDFETRDGTTGATSFGSFAPPRWVVDEVAEKARAGRTLPNLVREAGPPNAPSMTIPRITTGSTTAIQASENAAISETDIVTAQLTRATATIAGMQDVSVQGVELATPGTDELVFSDLIADYNRALDSQMIIGSGASGQLLGLDNLSGVNSVTYTDATPTVGEFYAKLADATQQVHTGRFEAPTAILMHPRRWAWFLAERDTTGRPIVPAEGPTNSPGGFSALAAQGNVGSLAGLPVFTSANIPTNLGGGTEDEVYVARFSDMLLYEGPLRTEVFRDVGSATLTIRFRVYSFVNFFAGRFPAGVSKITGTGLIAPSFV